MVVENEIIERIKKVNWFSNCGGKLEKSIKYEITYISNWKKAIKQSQGKYWEEITQEVENELTEFLFHNHPEKYHGEWNKIVREGKKILEEYVVPYVSNYIQKNELTKVILDNVKWDILGAIMEYTYRNEKEPAFYMELLKVYEAGNFPCGWKGSWPEGKLIVF
ncbi:hypothetical protein [Clostridium sp. DJ247]|uniref:hypothetical protein n=1 Tax=Clostridium sp. DJ247 TaxID=2726188 RepID=UPI001625F401|nr:hypothetical protein [Clostridium sp. DJ247]MBC2580551.1 hypothetical protein [Clostridium sp. DJ247]